MVISRDSWEKLIQIPIKYLSEELRAKVRAHGSLICDFVKGKQIEYKDHNGEWILITDPAFCEEVKYRVYQPKFIFTVEIQQDAALAVSRALKGQGLNSMEKIVVEKFTAEFENQFNKVFKPEETSSKIK